ncbi:hypothetical protein CPB83DRAFT_900767 [Crepidotus variabilis]|uniref:Uncharacterized protein n=1 Tax=Crepidotus variabilis TaxID=179855 RepID=A0A9P6BBP4_9AGAR|nr:hypothetical protein CPB83DRAFT_900767 [Crepidotus variabilis]
MPCYCTLCYPSKPYTKRTAQHHLELDRKIQDQNSSKDPRQIAQINTCIRRNYAFITTGKEQEVLPDPSTTHGLLMDNPVNLSEKEFVLNTGIGDEMDVDSQSDHDNVHLGGGSGSNKILMQPASPNQSTDIFEDDDSDMTSVNSDASDSILELWWKDVPTNAESGNDQNDAEVLITNDNGFLSNPSVLHLREASENLASQSSSIAIPSTNMLSNANKAFFEPPVAVQEL